MMKINNLISLSISVYYINEVNISNKKCLMLVNKNIVFLNIITKTVYVFINLDI